MFKADKPIEAKEEDLLFRYDLVKIISESIFSYSDEQSLTIGLFGDWGAGKTSTANLVIENLNSYDNELKPIIIKFKPWYFSSEHYLLSQFFKQLFQKIRSNAKLFNINTRSLQNVMQHIEAYLDLFKPLHKVPIVGKYPETISGIIKTIGRLLSIVSPDITKDADALRLELNKFFIGFRRKVVVLIDDVDRMELSQIRQTFVLINSLCDFPNVIYILPMVEKIIHDALKDFQGSSKERFLDKIIQIKFYLPAISPDALEKIYTERLIEITNHSKEIVLDITYLSTISAIGLKNIFSNIRQITKICNNVAHMAYSFKKNINVVDLFVLTSIKLLFPDFYCGLEINKDILIGKKKDTDQIIRRLITQNVNPQHWIFFQKVLECLFPQIQKTIIGNYTILNEQAWDIAKRACSPNHFNTYFFNDRDAITGRINYIHSLLSADRSKNGFEYFLTESIKRNEHLNLLNLISDSILELKAEDAELILTAILNTGDLFPKVDFQTSFAENPYHRSATICYNYLHNLVIPNSRHTLLDNLLNGCTVSLYSPLYLVNFLNIPFEDSKIKTGLASIESIFEESQFRIYKIKCIRMIQKSIKDRLFLACKYPIEILSIWEQWENHIYINEFFQKNVFSNNDLLLDFISLLKKNPHYNKIIELIDTDELMANHGDFVIKVCKTIEFDINKIHNNNFQINN